MPRKWLEEGIAGNVVKLGLYATAAIFDPAGAAPKADDVIETCASLALATVKARGETAEKPPVEAGALFEKAKQAFGHEARFDIAAGKTISLRTEV